MERLRRNNLTALRGFTLLEVLLSIALAAMLLAGIGMAIKTHLRVVDSSRSGVEDIRLSNTVLSHMRSDISGVVHHEKFDPSGLTGAAAKAGAATVANAASSLLGGTAAAPSATDIAGAIAGSETDTESSGADSMPKMTPGLYGYADWLQIDIARLPRLDEYDGKVSEDGTALIPPADVKTVVYFIGAPSDASPGGLMRRELPRLTTLYSIERNEDQNLDVAAQSIAPEVTGINFAYFDGTQWTDSWDSASMEALPVAVEVLLRMEVKANNDAGEPIERVFRTVIQLAAGQPTIEEIPPEASSATDSSASGTGSTGTGSTGTGSSGTGSTGSSGSSSKGSTGGSSMPGSNTGGGTSKGSTGSSGGSTSKSGGSTSGGSTGGSSKTGGSR